MSTALSMTSPPNPPAQWSGNKPKMQNAANQMPWVQKMNNIRNRATEIVNAEVVYS